MRQAVIFDMDGTLADVSSIRHYVVPEPGEYRKDFEKFHEESVNVPPIRWVAKFARVFGKRTDIDVIVVTARKAKWRHHTAWWLALHDIPSTALFMRSNDDNRRDVEVKRDILARIESEGWVVITAFDDNPSIIEFWKSRGIPTVTVAGWIDPHGRG